MECSSEDMLFEALSAFAVDAVYGLPGDGIDDVMASIGRRGPGVELVQVSHEQLLAFTAPMQAKLTEEVCSNLAPVETGVSPVLAGLSPGPFVNRNAALPLQELSLLSELFHWFAEPTNDHSRQPGTAKCVAIMAGQCAQQTVVQLIQAADLIGVPLVKLSLRLAVQAHSSTSSEWLAMGAEATETGITLLILGGNDAPVITRTAALDQGLRMQPASDLPQFADPLTAEFTGIARESLAALLERGQGRTDHALQDQAQQRYRDWCTLLRTTGRAAPCTAPNSSHGASGL